MTFPVSYRCGEEEINEKEKGDISSDYDDNGSRYISYNGGDSRGGISIGDVICGYRSKETSQVYSLNMGETVGGDRRVGCRSQSIQSSSHNPGDHDILLSISEF